MRWSIFTTCSACLLLILTSLNIFPTEIRPYLILFSDALIFVSVYQSAGIMSGLAFRCCTEEGFYTLATFSILEKLVEGLARFLGPPLARFLVEQHGMFRYCMVQALFCLIGAVSVAKVPFENTVEGDIRAGTLKLPGIHSRSAERSPAESLLRDSRRLSVSSGQ